MEREIRVTCPCCHAGLRVDVRTGKAVKEIRAGGKKKKKKDEPQDGPDPFEEALRGIKGSPGEAEDQFRKALDAEAHRAERLEDSFRKAKEEADESDEPPLNPYDND